MEKSSGLHIFLPRPSWLVEEKGLNQPVWAGLSLGRTTGQQAWERHTLSSACFSAEQAVLRSFKAGLVLLTLIPFIKVIGERAGFYSQVKNNKAWISMRSFCYHLGGKASFVTQLTQGFLTPLSQ